MAASNQVRIVITAKDDAAAVFASLSTTVKNATKSMEDDLAATSKAANNTKKSFSDLLSTAQSALSGAASKVDGMANSVGGLLKGVMAVGVTGSTGFIAMGKAAFDQVRSVENARAIMTGYGASVDDVNKALGKAVAFVRSDLGKMFQRQDIINTTSQLYGMGIALDKTTQGSVTLAKATMAGNGTFDEFIQVLRNVDAAGKLTTDQFQVLAARGVNLDKSLIGTKMSAQDLLNAMGGVLPDSLIAGRADTIDGKLITLKSSFRDLGNQILGVDADTSTFVEGGAGDRLMQMIDGLIASLKTPEMKTAFKNLGTQLADLASTAIPAILNGLKWLSENFDKVILAIKILVPLFLGLKTAAMLLNVFATITGVIKGVIGVVKVATTVFKALGAAMAANPVGAIIVGITLLVAAFIWLWNNVEGFRNFFIGIWKGIKTGVSAFVDWFKSIWEGISSFFSGVWDGIKAIFTGFIDWIKEWGLTVLAVIFWPFSLLLGFIIQNWAAISAFFTGIGQWLAGFFTGIWNGIVAIFTPVIQFYTMIFTTAWNAIMAVWNAVVGWFAGVWNGIVSVFNGVASWFGGIFSGAWNAIKSAMSPILGFFQGLWNGIVGIFSGIGSAISNAVGGAVKGAVNGALSIAEGAINGFIGLINGAIDIINHIPGVNIGKVGKVSFGRLAKGTEHADGGSYLVGENGPEMVTLPRGSKVMPAQRTANYLADNNNRGEVNITVNAEVKNDVDLYKLASQMGYMVSQI